MKGTCIDNKGVEDAIEIGKEYSLFPHGAGHYYVSNFDLNAHFGVFEKKFFQLIDENTPIQQNSSLTKNTKRNHEEQLTLF